MEGLPKRIFQIDGLNVEDSYRGPASSPDINPLDFSLILWKITRLR